jgi:hypothetical protein
MKWSTLLSKVVFAGQPPPPPPPAPASPLSQHSDHADAATPRLSSASTSGGSGPADEAAGPFDGYSPSSAATRWVPRRPNRIYRRPPPCPAHAILPAFVFPAGQWRSDLDSGSFRSEGDACFPPVISPRVSLSSSGDLVGRCGIGH